MENWHTERGLQSLPCLGMGLVLTHANDASDLLALLPDVRGSLWTTIRELLCWPCQCFLDVAVVAGGNNRCDRHRQYRVIRPMRQK